MPPNPPARTQHRTQGCPTVALAPTPAALAKRLAAARQRIATTARATIDIAATQAPPPPKPKPPNPPKAQAKPQQTARQHNAEQTKPARAKAAKGKATEGRPPAAASAAEIAAALRGAASNAPMARLVSDEQLVGIWQAIVDGAARLGPAGAADRAALGRAIGLPIHQYAGGGGRGPGGKQTGAEIAGRLETALERSRRRVPVTDTAADDESPVETAA